MGELGNKAEQFHRDVGELAKRKNVDGLFTIGKLSINASNDFGTGAFHFDSYEALEKALIIKTKIPIELIKKIKRHV